MRQVVYVCTHTHIFGVRQIHGLNGVHYVGRNFSQYESCHVMPVITSRVTNKEVNVCTHTYILGVRQIHMPYGLHYLARNFSQRDSCHVILVNASRVT